MTVSSLDMIVSSNAKRCGGICERDSANHDVSCPVMNLTKVNRHVNTAHTTAYAPPDFYSLFICIVYIHSYSAGSTDTAMERPERSKVLQSNRGPALEWCSIKAW